MTTSAVSEETRGTDFLLWATERERQAVRVVELFLKLASYVGRNEGLDFQMGIGVRDLHEHLPGFAACLVGDTTLYTRDEKGECPAVNLYLRMRSDGQSETISYMLYLFRLPEPPLPLEYWERAAERAKRTGAVPYACTPERLNQCTRETLVKMGALK
jgi:hypothetical protein